MKYISILMMTIGLATTSYAQTTAVEAYHPFPHDSLFFKPINLEEGNFSCLMPLVKSGDPEDMLLPVNNGPHWNELFFYFGNQSFRFPFKNWLGEVSYENQAIQFVTAFQDTITIRTDMTIGETDSMSYGENSPFAGTLEVHYDNLLTEGDDEIKEYSFTMTDAAGASPVPESYNIENIRFRISRDHGIINTPSFFYFPFCQEFTFHGAAADVLDQSSLNAYKVFHLNAGDEIHSYRKAGSTEDFYKKVCVNEVYDEDLERLIQTMDYWHLEKKVTYSNMSVTTTLEPSFEQRIDTIHLNEFVGLNKLLPDGYGEDVSDFGLFYDEEHSHFEMIFDLAAQFYDDSLTVGPYLDGERSEKRYKIGHGEIYGSGHYYNGGNGGSFFYVPRYTNFGGIEWGTPFSESFLLTIDEAEQKDFQLIVNANSIRLATDKKIESARIYNSNGSFVGYYSEEALQHEITTSQLAKGVYVFWIWDGKKSHALKFMK